MSKEPMCYCYSPNPMNQVVAIGDDSVVTVIWGDGFASVVARPLSGAEELPETWAKCPYEHFEMVYNRAVHEIGIMNSKFRMAHWGFDK